jgi:hypothetical protein
MTERERENDHPLPGNYADLLGAAAEVSAKAVDRLHVLHDRYPASLPPPVIQQVDRGHADPAGERRASVRLPGGEGAVTVRSPGTEQAEAAILDRSAGGLSLRLGEMVLPGAVLGVELTGPDAAGCVPVEVRHARPDGDAWVLGCSFVAERPPV